MERVPGSKSSFLSLKTRQSKLAYLGIELNAPAQCKHGGKSVSVEEES